MDICQWVFLHGLWVEQGGGFILFGGLFSFSTHCSLGVEDSQSFTSTSPVSTTCRDSYYLTHSPSAF